MITRYTKLYLATPNVPGYIGLPSTEANQLPFPLDQYKTIFVHIRN